MVVKDKHLKNYILIMLSGCLWGTIGLFVKLLDTVDSSSAYTTFMRMFFGFILLFLITLVKDGISAFRVSRNTMISCILLGIVSQSMNSFCYTNAVSRVGMSLGVALLYMAPVFTSIESKIFFKEKIGPYKIIALVVNVAGCVLAVTGGNFGGITISAVGIAFGIAAAFCYSTQNIFGRLATDDGTPMAVATYCFMWAAIFTAVAMRPWRTVENPLEPRLLLYGVLFALIPTAFAYILYFNGIQGLTETSKVPVLCSMEVVVATILGVVVFKEQIGIVNGIGMLCVLASIVIMNIGKKGE